MPSGYAFFVFNPSVASCCYSLRLHLSHFSGNTASCWTGGVRTVIDILIRPQAWHLKRHRNLTHLLCGPRSRLVLLIFLLARRMCRTRVHVAKQQRSLFVIDFSAKQLSKDGSKISRIYHQLPLLMNITVLHVYFVTVAFAAVQ